MHENLVFQMPFWPKFCSLNFAVTMAVMGVIGLLLLFKGMYDFESFLEIVMSQGKRLFTAVFWVTFTFVIGMFSYYVDSGHLDGLLIVAMLISMVSGWISLASLVYDVWLSGRRRAST